MRLNTFFTILISFLITASSFTQSIEREIAQGEEANEQLKQHIGFYEHSSSAYLNTIGQRLVSNLDYQMFDYRFGILDMTEPNAMALPGGSVYFSRGILVLANSEDELAGVVGHETIHVHKRHSRKTRNKSIFTGILKIPGAIVGVFAPAAGNILMAPFSLFDASYSRKHEKQADELGAKLAAKSGYDPAGLITILDKIAEDTKIETGIEEERSFFSTHPYTPKRVENLNKSVQKLNTTNTTPIVSDHKAFLDKLEGIVIGDNPAYGVFHDSLFLHPELNFTFSFPKEWEGINTPQVIGFLSADQKAQVILTLADTLKSPAKMAKEFVKNYYYYYRQEPVRNDSLKINGFQAHIISYEAYSDMDLVVFSLLWLKRSVHTYLFAMMSIDKYRNVIESMAKSLHVITDKERNLIKQTLLHIVQANQGENIEELSTRTGNVLDLEYTALINNLKTGEKLTTGQWIKIGVFRKY